MEQNFPHLSFEQLTDAALGGDLSADFSAHLRICPQCELESARLRKLIGVMRADRLEDAPAYAVANILRAFDEKTEKTRRAAQAETRSPLETLQAILSFDSRRTPAYGFRSAETSAARQLLYFAGETALDLRVEPRGEDWIISGQVLGQTGSFRLKLTGDDASYETETDAETKFRFSPVPNGKYALELTGENLSVVVPDLDTRT